MDKVVPSDIDKIDETWIDRNIGSGVLRHPYHVLEVKDAETIIGVLAFFAKAESTYAIKQITTIPGSRSVAVFVKRRKEKKAATPVVERDQLIYALRKKGVIFEGAVTTSLAGLRALAAAAGAI